MEYQYDQNTCPKTKLWFIDGGRCGTTIDCVNCKEVSEQGLEMSFVLSDDDQVRTVMNIEDMAGCFSINQTDKEFKRKDEVFIDLEALQKINEIASKIKWFDGN